MAEDKGATAGFTLIEILITIVILSTGIVVILQAFGTSTTALAQARDALFSAVLCERKLTDVKAQMITGNPPESLATGNFAADIYKDYVWRIESSLESGGGKSKKAKGRNRGKKKKEPEKLYRIKVSVWRDGYPDTSETAETFIKM